MGSKRAQVKEWIKKLQRAGCEVTPGSGHWRVTFNGVYVGALGSTPGTDMGLHHSHRKITARINKLKTTGRTWE